MADIPTKMVDTGIDGLQIEVQVIDTDKYTTPHRLADAIDKGEWSIEMDEDDDLYAVVVEDFRKGGFRTEERAWLWLHSLRAGLDLIDDDMQIPHNHDGTEIIYDAVSMERGGAPGWF